MRLSLPFRYPEVDIPAPLAVIVETVPPCGLPGTETNIYLPNGYGLSLLHGRGYSTHSTVEAHVITHHGSWESTEGCATTDVTRGDTDTEGWVDGEWITRALLALAVL